ncbi:nucleoside hydrolase-like domain-containing protein [Pseudozobellia sp. WGM2]|uniref:nucleoside hydrolase-like domain-containing protein n=1 Tax=Pseudozobellia sp. WGM2 TaxID=2787625 RepID=UPI001AE0B4DE|nr:nucleoside hydrolase-like domain-containing protein [Pseudozobellia sp. WGM2]
MKVNHKEGRLSLFILLFLILSTTFALGQDKNRLVVLTDIGGDPDDQMSLVRLLVYANHFDIEGLIATPHGGENFVEPQYIESIVKAYGQVRNNLELHEPDYPTEKELLNVIAKSVNSDDMKSVGGSNDSSGSELLIAAVDKNDERPLWVTVWGGPSVLAHALWKVRETRSTEELNEFVSKLRVYAISDQDNTGPWIRKEFPNLFYIVTPGVNVGGGFHHATWIAIGGDKFHGRFGGADFSLVTNEWLDENVRNEGPLGAKYPRWKFMMEGDTPSFFNLINNGLSNPERPDWGGWGGRYELYTPKTEKWFLEPETRPIWTNVQDEVLGNDGEWHTTNHATIWRWREAYQNDFSARMDWTVKPYAEANHPPEVILDHSDYIVAKPGEKINLSATKTFDPDGDELSYKWFCYEEPGTRSMSNSTTGIKHTIHDSDKSQAWLKVKTSRVMPPGTGTMHIILAVTDHGSPNLTRYKRIIIDVVE